MPLRSETYYEIIVVELEREDANESDFYFVDMTEWPLLGMYILRISAVAKTT